MSAIDNSERAGRALTDGELDALDELIAKLDELGHETPTPRTSVLPQIRMQGRRARPDGKPRVVPDAPLATARRRSAAPPPATPAIKRAPPPAPAEPVAPTSAGGYAAPTRVVHVLTLLEEPTRSQVSVALADERYELSHAADALRAARLAWTHAPDVVLADAELALGPSGLLERLRREALTDFIPVVLFADPASELDPVAAREAGAVEALRRPVVAAKLLQTVHRVANLSEAAEFAPLGDLTVEDVAARIADEIRRGLVQAADRGEDVVVPLGDGSEILAAAWAAIARVRAHLSERSAGRVHFSDPTGQPALVSLSDSEAVEGEAQAPDPSLDTISLRGRRILVADDDPAVLWFFAQLFQDEGAVVDLAENGREALAIAQAQRPEVILTDILMPELDGLALCRELARDPALSEVPIVLLSWREDFLARMRELRAGASGYLRKEAESSQILSRVREVLRPRAQLEARIKAGGEVRGRVEGVGIPALLELVILHRPSARVVIRDAFHLFELDVIGGEIASITTTASDGSFARGDRALSRLVGVHGGRFAVTDPDGSPRPSFTGGAPRESLDTVCANMAGLIRSVSGENVDQVASLSVDEDALESFRASAPGEVARIALAVSEGRAPSELLVGRGFAPHAVQAALVDMVRRGVIIGALDEYGHPFSADAAPEEAASGILGAAPPPLPTQRQDESATEGSRESDEDLAQLVEEAERASMVPAALAREEAEADELMHVIEDRHLELDNDALVPHSLAPVPAVGDASGPAAAAAKPEAGKAGKAVASEGEDEAEGEGGTDGEPAESFGWFSWVVLLTLLGSIGYLGYEFVRESTERAPREAPSSRGENSSPPAPPAPMASAAEGEPAEAGRAPDTPSPVAAADDPEAPVESAAGLRFGALRPGAEAVGTGDIPEGHGVLHVLAAEGPETRVFVGDQELGIPPQRAILPEGRHDVRYVRGDETLHRFYFIRADHTRVVPVPTR